MVSSSGSITLATVLKDIVLSGSKLKPVNGHIKVFASGNLLIGHLNDFTADGVIIPEDFRKSDCLIVFDKAPDLATTTKYTVVTSNCYTLRVAVELYEE